MFQIEEGDNHKILENVMFYDISSKRYRLYKVDNGEINILKYSTHGLGHLKEIDDKTTKRIWKSIVKGDFEFIIFFSFFPSVIYMMFTDNKWSSTFSKDMLS
ncbi:MAG: hypothetical protein ACP5L4_06785, partial [Thermoplasmata archaeon]